MKKEGSGREIGEREGAYAHWDPNTERRRTRKEVLKRPAKPTNGTLFPLFYYNLYFASCVFVIIRKFCEVKNQSLAGASRPGGNLIWGHIILKGCIGVPKIRGCARG
jgi:hypothetical protein